MSYLWSCQNPVGHEEVSEGLPIGRLGCLASLAQALDVNVMKFSETRVTARVTMTLFRAWAGGHAFSTVPEGAGQGVSAMAWGMMRAIAT